MSKQLCNNINQNSTHLRKNFRLSFWLSESCLWISTQTWNREEGRNRIRCIRVKY